MAKKKGDGIKAISDAIDGATMVDAARPPQDDAPKDPRDPDTGRPSLLDEGCVVVPLGKLQDTCYYLDANRQLVELKARDHGRLAMMGMFGARPDQLYSFWPRKRQTKAGDWEVTGWRPEEAAEALMAECAALGIWEPFTKLRGSGAWLAEDGGLVLHCGDQVLCNGRWHQPGTIGGHVYPAGPAMPRPDMSYGESEITKNIDQLHQLLKTWNWRRPDIDVRLLIGWIGAALLGGALRYRPLVWITGDRGTGKTVLHEVLKAIFAEALLSVSDATSAGVWQKLGMSSHPVALDEMEAEEDNRRQQNVIKLARQAATGGVVLRGGQDHQGTEFTARACFLFSSILLPPLLGQDRSRLAILDLNPFGADAKAPIIDLPWFGKLGRLIRARLVANWPRMQQTLHVYHMALHQMGFDGRGADQFGTLLACADMLLAPGLDVPEASAIEPYLEWMKDLHVEREGEEARDQERCAQHLISSPLDTGGRDRRLVMQWINQARGTSPDQLQLPAANDAGMWNEQKADMERATLILGQYGLKLWIDPHNDHQEYLAVANAHQGLQTIFAGTHWSARSGAAGVWVQALRRIPGARVGAPMRFNGVNMRCTLVPLQQIDPPDVKGT